MFPILLFAVMLAAFGSGEGPPQIRLFVSGKLASTGVVQLQGKYLVPLEDIATALGATTTVVPRMNGDTSIKFVMPETTDGNSGTGVGRVRGVVTYYFNENYGSKPDTGAEVYLVAGEVSIPMTSVLTVSDRLSTITVSTPKKGDKTEMKTASAKLVARTAVGGDGTFLLDDVPVGSYTLVIRSKHSTDNTARDVSGMIEHRLVDIKAGKTTDATHDFRFNLR